MFVVGDDLYPETPDAEGANPPMTIPYTAAEARINYPKHNRNEMIKDDSDQIKTTSRCNIKMADGQVNPINGFELLMQRKSVL